MPAEPLQKVCTKSDTGVFGTGNETLLHHVLQQIDFSENKSVGAVNRGREKAEKRRKNAPKTRRHCNKTPRNMAGIQGVSGEKAWGEWSFVT
jgi:hypothetical protein